MDHSPGTMKETAIIQIRPLDKTHHEWAKELLEQAWGATEIVTRGRTFDAAFLPGFVALREDSPIGLTNYRMEGDECELMTLNSLKPGLGIDSVLVEAVKKAAVKAGCRRLWVITTNDNTRALRFYQQRGFELVALYKNALVKSRHLKPQIPLVSDDGIPLRDEIELEIRL